MLEWIASNSVAVSAVGALVALIVLFLMLREAYKELKK